MSDTETEAPGVSVPEQTTPETAVDGDGGDAYVGSIEPVTGPPAPAAESASDRYLAQAGEFAERAGETASELADRAGDALERAAGATGRIASQVVDRLRNNAELSADRGSTTIANEVVEKIAAIAAREVPGVYDLGGDVARLFGSLKEKIGLGKGGEDADQGVSVRLEGNQAAVKLVVVIEYGFVVYSVTEKVRAKVISAVENLLGLEVTEVDIVVDDVHVPDDAPAGDDENRAVDFK
jgi:uncharacterized alkaline shock family protein YloU